MGKKLAEDRFYVETVRGLEGFKERYSFNSRMRNWETRCMQCELEFKKLMLQTDMNKVEPM